MNWSNKKWTYYHVYPSDLVQYPAKHQRFAEKAENCFDINSFYNRN